VVLGGVLVLRDALVLRGHSWYCNQLEGWCDTASGPFSVSRDTRCAYQRVYYKPVGGVVIYRWLFVTEVHLVRSM
jgi:hypothetical protein